MILSVENLREMTPRSHAVLPVGLVETLIDAAWRAYLPAFGGSEVAVAEAFNAAQAAQNVLDRAALGRGAALTHQLYKTGDADAPMAIKDRNGEVTLDCCRICGKGEIELTEPCVDNRVCVICDGGPGNACACLCGFEKWETG